MSEPKLPACWLADLIHALMARGSFGRMAADAIIYAETQKRYDDANLYRNIREQVADYYSQSDDGTIHITFRPDK